MQKFKSTLSLKSSKLNLLRRKDKNTTTTSPSKMEEKPRQSSSPMPTHVVVGPSSNMDSPKKIIRTPPSSPELSHKKRRTGEYRASSKSPDCQRQPTLSDGYGRHKVNSIARHILETHLEIESLDTMSEKKKKCILKGSWVMTDVKIGDVVNILADYDKEIEAFVVDEMNGMLIVDPDHLISGTSIVSSLFCMRKAVLNEIFKGAEGGSKTMFVGTLLHELLQGCLRQKITSSEQVRSTLDKMLSSQGILQDILLLEMTVADLRLEVEPFIPHICFFTDKYILGKNVSLPGAVFSGSQQQGNRSAQIHKWPGKIEEIQDIEENIWSPRLGIKGKIDLTVNVKLNCPDNKGRSKKVMPLELKTGRASGSVEHRGQVILYSMMMSERRQDPEAGLLLYLRNSSMQEVKAGVHEMRGLIQLRNQLVYHLKKNCIEDENGVRIIPELPEPLNLKRACGQCPHLTVCALHQKIKNDIPRAPHAMSELVPQTLSHLTDVDVEFFNKWNIMCYLEGQSARSRSNLKALWCKTPSAREKSALCVSNLVLNGNPSDNVHNFERQGQKLSRIFNDGETVVVSSDTEIALSQGIVLCQSEHGIRIALDRDLSVNHRDKTFHLDKYEYQGGMSGNLVNVAKLLSPNSEAERLRKFIIKKEPVTFLKGLSREVIDKGKHILQPLNRVQQKAIFKTMMAEGYVLIKGMPGTGKTTMIVAMVRVLVAMGKRILLTSYTHSAVDTILLKLKEHDETKFVRLGRKSRIHEELTQFSADEMTKDFKKLNELKHFYSEIPVVATTCLGLNHPAVQNNRFDYCILDEAAQSMMLASLGPLFYANKFVLVGDPEQLPPVVQNKEAKDLGMAKSLFEHLEVKENTIPLNIQYRMNSVIMECANGLVYDGLLECGSYEVSSRTLKLTAPVESSKRFIQIALSANLDDSVVFLNTSQTSACESLNGQGVVNAMEVDIVKQICDGLVHYGLSEVNIGVIAPFNAQVNLLKKTLVNIEVNTVDQFQGKDKDVILFSCTRSRNGTQQQSSKESDILSDTRRLNVALTRAKCKFIMIGNKETLDNYPNFLKIFSLIKTTHIFTQDEL